MKETTVIKVEAFAKADFIDQLALQLLQERRQRNDAIHNRR